MWPERLVLILKLGKIEHATQQAQITKLRGMSGQGQPIARAVKRCVMLRSMIHGLYHMFRA